MRFYFIRHAQSENNALWDRTRSDNGRKVDPELTALGREQAQLVARYIAENHDPHDGRSSELNFGLTHIYCSPMYRAIATADCIGRACNLRPQVWVDWHECGGMYLDNLETKEKESHPGLNRQEMISLFPNVVLHQEIKQDGWWNKGWESEEHRPVRARRVLQELLKRHHNTDSVVAVVSHGAFYMHFLAAILGLEKIKPVWFLMNNTGMTRIDFSSNDTTVVFHNFVGHLDQLLIS